jgi:hypothetical protein
MAYTPELSQEHSGILRRIAWALELPMTKAIEEVLDHVGTLIDSKKVCRACRDRSFCKDCSFNHNGTKKQET